MWFNNGTVIYSMFLVVEGVNVDSSIRTKLGTCIVSSDPLDSPPHSRNWPCPLFTLLTSRPSNLDPMESLFSAPARFWVPTLAFHKFQFVSKIDNFPCQLLSCLCPGGWRGKNCWLFRLSDKYGVLLVVHHKYRKQKCSRNTINVYFHQCSYK